MKIAFILIVSSTLLGVGGCVPLGEIEQENADLLAKVDSLKEQQDACTTQLATLATRIKALEQENIKLSDQNTQLTTRLSDLAALPVAAVQPGEAPPQISAPSDPVPQTGRQESRPSEQQPVSSQDPPVAPAKTQAGRTQPPATTAIPPVQSVSSAEPADEAFLSRYQNALADFNSRRYDESIREFNALLNSSRPNDMTDNCAYWIGEALFAQRNYRDAISWFNTVLVSRGSDKIDDALMMRGNTYLRLDQPSKAAEDFQRVVNEFPNGEFFSAARAKLKSIRSVPRGTHVTPNRRK